ncbi:S1/P1 nuclease [Mesorhizobium qingshengii]|uniref:S1/P1 nuclease n=1 Tax=Mesorhizobium qingshengii TaxID=1165689 RepID=A0ABT4R442_9HYPH|nr:S1/P1 nuclease [Mesorhizobium qingshengii]MCZ8548591.1 S1/P1 nuclease [Mesorhizobium qingshengii]
MRRLALAVFGLCFYSSYASAWWDEGHMRIAAMAWDQLTPAARAEASRLVRMNPQYFSWMIAIPQPYDGSARDLDRYAFIRAAVWADDIKEMKDYKDASTKDNAKTETAGRNIGYSDKLIHGYWHFKDIPYQRDGSVPPPADPVDAATQIKAFTAALPKAAGMSDDIRSYDLVWLLHLIGDVHQPLHSTALFTKEFTAKWKAQDKPDQGDRGGNEIMVTPANGDPVNLHAYFDGMFGGYSTVYGAIFDTFDKSGNPYLPPADGTEAAITDPDVWVTESNKLAIDTAYAAPVLDANGNVVQQAELTRQYETKARNVSKLQIPLAAARLAHLLNEALK